ncbi:hypothetical protein VC83_06022 [Pseudogymnoascus destructans]|uniref:DUF7730 domain-containing protein n=2 Tax=Pseudogymnoascus destructans TaxID=655981 RepID=L8FVG0_PSED2|nr:uncharacterized protein VC83_06022 [Pseudogymnoascus destructans]ELR03721.1 hypothetical protein GMDG_06355 [Pseudogymnoascus destructans 20631-21]OAF57048.1 hypothetical protein VC83_06022 [Pseudogymnoascus destructans]
MALSDYGARSKPFTKAQRGPAQLKPLVTATLRQARRLTRRRSPEPALPIAPAPVAPPPANSPPSMPTASLFLTFLPPEIRARIYHFVFAGRELLLGVRWNIFTCRPSRGALRYREINSDHTGGKWQAGWRGEVVREYPDNYQYLEFKQEPGEERKLLKQEPGEERNLLGLALCCRQVYAESIRFLYASTGFTFWYQPSLGQFVHGNTKRVDYMRWVRVMRLEFQFSVPVVAGGVDVRAGWNEVLDGQDWEDICRCLGLMTGLRVLHVSILPSDTLVNQEWADDMVWAMLELLRTARADEFRVSVRKPFMKFREVLGEAPFELYEVYEDY